MSAKGGQSLWIFLLGVQLHYAINQKKIISILLLLALTYSICMPAFAVNKENETNHYYSSCTFNDGSIIEGRILDNGNLLISLSKNNVLVESTEVDYSQQVLIYTDASAKSRISSKHEIPFSSFIEPVPSGNTNSTGDTYAFANRPFTHFADVSFRTQIGTDYYFTPKAQVYVRNNTPGDLVKQRVRVSDLGEGTTTIVSGFSVVLGLAFPDLNAVKSFLISLGVFTADLIVSPIVDYVSLEATRYGETLKATYENEEIVFDEGAHIVASANVEKNGKYANQTFYDGMCKQNILDKKLAYGSGICTAFFKGYGTPRSMSVIEV